MIYRKIIIIGGGGHGRVLRDCLDTCGGYEILGYSDLKACSQMDVPYLGQDQDILQYCKFGEIRLINGIGSASDLPKLHQQIFIRFKKVGFSFETVVHPKAFVSSRAKLSEGVQIMAGAMVNTGTQIDENVIINTSSSVDHDCMIGAHTHIAPGVTVSGGVQIGSGCHIGTGAKVIQAVTIGQDVMIAAGSVVINHVPKAKKYAGIPAKEITYR